MASRDQTQGFEKEAKYHEILWEAVGECPNLKAKTIRKIIAQANPQFIEGLFDVRPCVRRLRYVGVCGGDSEPCSTHPFFKQGEIYESTDFTGGTYTIVGYKDEEGNQPRIGYSHFEWVEDDPGEVERKGEES